MDARGWEQVRAAFDEVVELQTAERANRLAAIGAANPELRRAVESLLRADAHADAELATAQSPLQWLTRVPAVGADSAPETPDPFGLSGRTVSHFRLLEPLGAGGMGMLYRAEDTRLGRAVALKFLLPQYDLDASAKVRFLHEARLAARLDHANLCTIYEVGESEDGRLFLAMALYAGQTLAARLRRDARLDVREALDIARQIAEGLNKAHTAGIVHRDLKPGNVMLLPDGTVKILDFGLAKARDLSLTGPGIHLGTLSYMAPEQVLGEVVDARTDLWALGAVLYEMLTGSRPFVGDHELSVAHAIVHREPVRPSAIRPGLPATAEELILTLLKKDASRRCPSAAAALSALAAIQPVGAPLPKRRRRWLRQSTRTHIPLPASRRAILGFVAFGAVAAGTSFILTAREHSRSGREDIPAERSVAVLPFDNLSADEQNEFLAGGLQEAVITQLTTIADLRVISRQSVRAYAGTKKPLRDIGEELGAGRILQASLQSANDQVRLTAQFMDARVDKLLWAKQYERRRADLFMLQNEVARDIAEAVQARLTPSERERLTQAPTRNAEAYTFYMKGREYQQRAPGLAAVVFSLGEQETRAAESLYRRAVELDASFALAHAYLAQIHGDMYRGRYDRTPIRLELMRAEAETALRLQPDLAEAHLAMGLYWHVAHRDYRRAAAEFEIARRGLPNDAHVQSLIADSRRRQGRWEEALVGYRQALTLDPRQAANALNLAFAYQAAYRYADAARAWDHAIGIAPDHYRYALEKARVFVRWQGNTDSLAATLRRIPPDFDPGGQTTLARADLARLRRRPAEALAALAAMRPELLQSGDYISTSFFRLNRGWAREAVGDTARARADYEAARATLETADEEHRNDPHLHAELAMVYAALGQKREAIREARRAMQLTPVSQDAWEATIYMHHAAYAYTRIGDWDAALDLLEPLVTKPNWMGFSAQELRLDPLWDPLRHHPRFQRLLRKTAVRPEWKLSYR